MSGGVDSAVAALLARRESRDVQGLFMSNWDEDDAFCTQAQDFQDALATCRELGIPLHRVDFSERYRAQVFQHFLDELRAGRTPNPDVLCNREIKFGVCLEYARRLGAARLVTGHYARLIDGAAGPELHRGIDPAKDQSYFLHAVPPAAWREAAFPLGGLHKPEVRALARQAGLPVYDKPDSTGICFIGERPFREFLARHLPQRPGPILDEAGHVLGEHGGLAGYTLGQRGGLGIGGQREAPEQPWFVAAKDLARNALIVVQGHDHPALLSDVVEVVDPVWQAAPPRLGAEVAVKLRYRQPDQAARIAAIGDARMTLRMAAVERAVTPGQFAVLYDGSRCLGGGVIASATLSPYNPAASRASALEIP